MVARVPSRARRAHTDAVTASRPGWSDRAARILAALLTSAIALLCATLPAAAQFTQQGSKLVGSNAVGGSYQGFSVAVSGDGNTMIVGGFEDNAYAGAAWVFTRTDGVWGQQGSKLIGTGAVGTAWQGHSVALSGDGNTAIIGGPDDDDGVGAAWIFTRGGGVWTQQGPKLVGSRDSYGQGFSVALSSDGNTAIIGAPFTSAAGTGAAWVFHRFGKRWRTTKLVGADSRGPAWQGFSVALSADGNTAIVGGPYDASSAEGAAWVFKRVQGSQTGVEWLPPPDIWIQQGPKLVGSGAVVGVKTGALEGYSVAMSGDGKTAMLGGPNDSSAVGAAWVFTASGGVWSQQGSKLTSGEIYQIDFGSSVALSNDGNTAIIGAPGGSSGSTFVFGRSGTAWSPQGAALLGTGAVGNYSATQGTSVALSPDASTAIVGGPGDNNLVGTAWVFVQTSPDRFPTVTTGAGSSATMPADRFTYQAGPGDGSVHWRRVEIPQ